MFARVQRTISLSLLAAVVIAFGGCASTPTSRPPSTSTVTSTVTIHRTSPATTLDEAKRRLVAIGFTCDAVPMANGAREQWTAMVGTDSLPEAILDCKSHDDGPVVSFIGWPNPQTRVSSWRRLHESACAPGIGDGSPMIANGAWVLSLDNADDANGVGAMSEAATTLGVPVTAEAC